MRKGSPSITVSTSRQVTIEPNLTIMPILCIDPRMPRFLSRETG